MLRNYTLLHGTVGAHSNEGFHKTMSHYNFIVISNEDAGTDGNDSAALEYQVNIDIQSSPEPNVKYYIVQDFSHSILDNLKTLKSNNLINLAVLSKEFRADYLRSNLFPVNVLQSAQAKSCDDIAATLHSLITPGCEIYVLGEYYNDNQQRASKPYGLNLKQTYQGLPPRGIHDIHMNQGTKYDPNNFGTNGIYQDGAVFLIKPDYVMGFFFAFSTQCLSTDNHGDCLNKSSINIATS